MALTTRQAIITEMVDSYKIGRRGTNDATQSGLTTVSDDDVFGGQDGGRDIDNGCSVRVRQDSTAGGGGTVVWNTCRVSKRPTISGGTLTLDPPLITPMETPVVANNDTTFIVLKKPFEYDDVVAAIDQAYEYLPEKLMVPVTSAEDGDMLDQDASATSSWTASNSALAKSAASFPFGLRELQVTNSAANGYAESVAIPVETDQSYYVEASARVTAAVATATARLTVRDSTNSADLTVDNDETTEQEPQILASNVSMGSTTERITLRLGADENSVVSLWTNVIFRKNSATEFVIADRVELDRLGKLYVATRNEWADRQFEEVPHDLDLLTGNMWRYRARASVSGFSLWYEEYYKRASFTNDDSTTSAPKEAMAAVATYLLLRNLPAEYAERYAGTYQKAGERAAAYVGKQRAMKSYVNADANYAVPLPLV